MTDKATDKREPGFFQIDNELVENYQLTPYSAWLYCVIVKHAGKSTEAFPSIKTLATLANMSKPTVIKNLAELEKRNLITVKREKINSKQNAVNHYFVQDVVKNADLEYIEVVSQINQGGGKGGLPGVVKEVDRNKTQENNTKEKDSQPKVGGVQPVTEMGQGGVFTSSDEVKLVSKSLLTCDKCGHELKQLLTRNDECVMVCGCTVRRNNVGSKPPLELYDMQLLDTQYTEAVGQGDTCAKCGKTPLPLFDANNEKHMVCNCPTDLADTPCAHVFSDGECIDCGQIEPPRVIQDDEGNFIAGPVKIYTPTPRQTVTPLPPNDGRKVGRKPPSVDPAIKAATPINVIPRKERLVLPEEAEPEAKPKTKKDIRDEMKTAVLDAVGWQPSDVNHWGRIQKVVTTLLKKGATVELLAEWRDWNAALECGKVQNPEGITGNGWPKFMKHKRDQATPTHKPTPELDIQVEEKYS